MRLLVVEDEPKIAELVARTLRSAGFFADVQGSVADACQAIETIPYDAAVIDIGLPDGDGLNIVRFVRARGLGLPTLLLTARDAVGDRVAGLDAGGDDYLVKPFAGVELVARINALLRRPGFALGAVLEAGLLKLDTVGREAEVTGKSLGLPRQQLALLELFLRRLGRVIPKVALEEKLYGDGDDVSANTIPVHIHHLRQKLAEARAGCSIQTVRGVGYFLIEDVSS